MVRPPARDPEPLGPLFVTTTSHAPGVAPVIAKLATMMSGDGKLTLVPGMSLWPAIDSFTVAPARMLRPVIVTLFIGVQLVTFDGLMSFTTGGGQAVICNPSSNEPVPLLGLTTTTSQKPATAFVIAKLAVIELGGLTITPVPRISGCPAIATLTVAPA